MENSSSLFSKSSTILLYNGNENYFILYSSYLGKNNDFSKDDDSDFWNMSSISINDAPIEDFFVLQDSCNTCFSMPCALVSEKFNYMI